MKKAILIGLLAVAALLLSSHSPAPQTPNSPSIQPSSIQSQLDALTKRGFTYRFVDAVTLELTNEFSGDRIVRTLSEPSDAEIRSWALLNGIPVLVIDPNSIDTTKYAGWYSVGPRIPLSNSFSIPLLVGDLNRNDKPEIYGRYKDTIGAPVTQIHELDSSLTPNNIFQYAQPMFARTICDLDSDSLHEILFAYGDSAFLYEQPSATSLPTQRVLSYTMWEYPGTSIYNLFKLVNLDGDDQVDFVYMGSQVDSNRPSGFRYCTVVAEYDSSIGNFHSVWSNEIDGGGFGGYDCNDYDADGRMEFSASDRDGHIWVFENQGNNNYGISWSDSVPLRNVYNQVSNDVDRDGRMELFIAASMSNGTWIIVFEPVQDNVFEPQFIIQILTSSLSESTYRSVDLDGDNYDDLVVFVGGLLFRFNASANNDYFLSFYMRPSAGNGIQFADIDKNGHLDIIANGIEYTQTGTKYFAESYLATDLVNVSDQQHSEGYQESYLRNHPNPFNETTVVRFFLPNQSRVRISVYSILGELTDELANGLYDEGEHSLTWKASSRSSGVYLLRMDTEAGTTTRKVILLR